MTIVLKFNKKNPDQYYSVNDITFPKDDDVYGVLFEIIQNYDLEQLCSFLSEEWPLKYGEAVNMMIGEGYLPDNFEEDKSELSELYNEDLFYALCKYPLNSISYFSDQFSSGTQDTDAMLKKVCSYINDNVSSDSGSDKEFDPVAELDTLMKQFDDLNNSK